jgi:NitT/TauT family transport system substrate-binding protein
MLVAVSCSSVIGASGASAAAKTPITIAVVPYSGLAATGLGQVKGIYGHYGLNVTLAPASNITIIIAELQSGQYPLGYLSEALMVQAIGAGVAVKCVAPVGPTTDVIKGYPQEAIIVGANSSVTSLSDLDGKTLALPTLSGANYLAAKAAVSEGGANWASIHLTALPYVDMDAAVSSGEVQAAFQLSPYIEQGTQAGEVKVLHLLDGTKAGTPGPPCFAATDSYIHSHKALLTKFVEAQDQAILFANAHKAEANAQIATVSGIPASDVILPPKSFYTDSLLLPTMHGYESFMKTWGGLTGPILPVSYLAWVASGTPMTTLLFNASGKYTGGS